jgi:enamine deaminase RidA (YjgF/YER057c/UK114 family)
VRRLILLAVAAALAADLLPAQRKKKKKAEEEFTQTLPALPDPPLAVSAETSRLEFHAAAMSGKGLLSRQTRDALDDLFRKNRGATIIKLRAFVAGSGDLRRVTTIVAEEFSRRKSPPPALSIIQVGALPLEGAQIALESVSAAKKPVNPAGVVFFSGRAAPTPAESVDRLSKNVADSGATVVRVTCFLSSLDLYDGARRAVAASFGPADATFVQLQRLPVEPVCECEAVGRLEKPPARAVELVNPGKSPLFAQYALVNAPKVILTGSQMMFGSEEQDLRLGFERLGKALESQGGSFRSVVMSNTYPLAASVRDGIRKIRFDYYNQASPPASTVLLFEGLPSIDATAAVAVIAAVEP